MLAIRVRFHMSECLQCLLNPINQRVTHQVEPQIHSLQVDLVHVLVTTTSYDEVQQKLPCLKPQTVLGKVQILNTSAQTQSVG